MKKTWKVNQVDMIPMNISNEEYQQILEELSEIVYEYLYPSVPELEMPRGLKERETNE